MRCGGHDEWTAHWGLDKINNSPPLYVFFFFFYLTFTYFFYLHQSVHSSLLWILLCCCFSCLGFKGFHNLYCCTVSAVDLACELQKPRGRETGLFAGWLI